MSEQDPVSRSPETEPVTGPETTLSDDALEGLLAEHQPATETEEDAVEAAPPEPEQVEEEVVQEEPAEEAEPAVEQEAAEIDQEEEKPAEEADPNEDIRLQLEELSISNKLLESQVGRSTGNEGYLKNKIRQLEAQLADRATQPAPQVDEYGDPLEAPPTAPAPAAAAAAPADPAVSYMVDQATRDGGNEFVSEIAGGKPVAELPEDDQKAILEAVNSLKTDERRREQFLQIRGSGDPGYARSATRDLLTTAYLSLRRSQIRERRQQLRETASASLKKRKQAASVTQSTKATAPTRKRTPTDVRQLSDEDLQKLGGIY